VAHFERLFRVAPRCIACDLHPNYLASRYAQERARAAGLPLVQVQHHHAHLAACLADNGWASTDQVIGLCFDGTGYGTDGAIWGGEVLLGGYQGFQRRCHLKYTPQPGGDAAARKPARMALAHLWAAGIDWQADLPPALEICAQDRSTLAAQLKHAINTPLTSSMGRLFDAASALLGVRQTATYEGQAAIELEALADPVARGCYDFDLVDDQFDPAPVWAALLADWRAGLPLPVLSARFHNSVAQVSLALCRQIRVETGVDTAALSGGVWQNRFLLHRTVEILEQDGFTVFSHRRVPTNDGGIALGQLLVAAFRPDGER
jgi:hydrogenase maturation protein HypF